MCPTRSPRTSCRELQFVKDMLVVYWDHMQVWAAYSPVKNAPEDARAKVAAGSPSHSATTGELDIYHANCR